MECGFDGGRQRAGSDGVKGCDHNTQFPAAACLLQRLKVKLSHSVHPLHACTLSLLLKQQLHVEVSSLQLQKNKPPQPSPSTAHHIAVAVHHPLLALAGVWCCCCCLATRALGAAASSCCCLRALFGGWGLVAGRCGRGLRRCCSCWCLLRSLHLLCVEDTAVAAGMHRQAQREGMGFRGSRYEVQTQHPAWRQHASTARHTLRCAWVQTAGTPKQYLFGLLGGRSACRITSQTSNSRQRKGNVLCVSECACVCPS